MHTKFSKFSTFVLGAAIAGTSQFAHADWSLNIGGMTAAEEQDVVITMKANPRKNLEQACLAVTLARSLADNKPNANVTLFVTLDGVSLAKERVIKKRRLKCTVPGAEGMEEITLKENVEAFIKDDQNAMVVCPICWAERYGEKLPDYGVLPISADTTDLDGSDHIVSNKGIGTMIFNADKILDF